MRWLFKLVVSEALLMSFLILKAWGRESGDIEKKCACNVSKEMGLISALYCYEG